MNKYLDPRNILTIPQVYTAFQWFARGNKAHREYVEKYINPKAGQHILDIGCGPGDILKFLPEVNYIGFDMSERYIELAKKIHGDRGKFFCSMVNEDILRDYPKFDRVLANAVLHHLDDNDAIQLFKLAKAKLIPDGKLVTLDGCFTDDQSWMARYLISIDRGKHVRDISGYLNLAKQVFPKVSYSIDHNLFRIPYTIMIMECFPD